MMDGSYSSIKTFNPSVDMLVFISGYNMMIFHKKTFKIMVKIGFLNNLRYIDLIQKYV